MPSKDKNKIVYIVHCVDTEGPLHESIDATFARLKNIFNIANIEHTEDNLRKLQNKKINLNGLEDAVTNVVSYHLLQYNDTWEKVDKMLLEIMSDVFRKKFLDSFGNGWIYNWHCMDHVGYVDNPRKRDMGIHKIFDHYQNIIKKTNSHQDAIHWHFHPMSIYKEAHRSATSYLNSPNLYEILCSRIIDREWFPVVHRAGFHTERPDSHWFLEQWIPFDISNKAIASDNITNSQQDLVEGRFGDWRLAPSDWSIYQPSHDNYQIPGNCKRWIARILNLKTRHANINQKEVNKAFARAGKGLPTILGITNHDFRDMAAEIDSFRKMLAKAVEKYPKVQFKYCEVREAFRKVIYKGDYKKEPFELKVKLSKKDDSVMVLEVNTIKGKIFGVQPFLAIKTKSGRFIHDNFDFSTSLNSWSYIFDKETVHSDDVAAVGVASNDKYGNQFIKVIKF